MIFETETFDNTFPFAPHFSETSGFRMHYVDEGRGPAILCLHGVPTWGYFYRHIIPPLSKNHRVIAPDYMGFGKSETPQDKKYTLQVHIDNLERLVIELDLKNITLVVHDWGGPIGSGLALRHPDRIARIVVMNTFLPLGMPKDGELLQQNNFESAWFKWVNRAVADKTFEPTLRNAGVSIIGLMKLLIGFEKPIAEESFFQAYSKHFATPKECEGLIAFPKSIIEETFRPEQGSPEEVTKVRSKPAIMIEGMKDKALLPKYFIPMFEAAFPQSVVYRIEKASHYLLEDEPVKIASIIADFIRETTVNDYELKTKNG